MPFPPALPYCWRLLAGFHRKPLGHDLPVKSLIVCCQFRQILCDAFIARSVIGHQRDVSHPHHHVWCERTNNVIAVQPFQAGKRRRPRTVQMHHRFTARIVAIQRQMKEHLFEGLSPLNHSPSAVTLESRCGSRLPRHEPVGVASKFPSGKSSDRLPAEPVAYPR